MFGVTSGAKWRVRGTNVAAHLAGPVLESGLWGGGWGGGAPATRLAGPAHLGPAFRSQPGPAPSLHSYGAAEAAAILAAER